MISIKIFILLISIIIVILTFHISSGLPVLKVLNLINIKNIVNIDNDNINDNINDNNDINNDNINDIINTDSNKNNNFNNNDYNLVRLANNYSVNATITKHILSFNPVTACFTGGIVISYNNNFDNHFNCYIYINPPNQTSSNFIQNYMYYEFNLGKLINLTCNNMICIFKTYYKYAYDFNKFICNIKHLKYAKEEF
jgi:hypothetical protein